MSCFRLTPLLCASLLLVCTACTPAQPAQPSGIPDDSVLPSVSQSAIPEPEPPSPDDPLPDEPSTPAMFVPEAPAETVPEPEKAPEPPPIPAQSVPSQPAEPELPPPAPAQPSVPESPNPSVREETTPVQPAPPLPTTSYDFSSPVPESAPVENDYFADAAFVGDSRTDGFYLFSHVKQGKNLSSNGLSVFTFDTKKALTIGGSSYTLLEALALQEYGKIYLGFGINDLGYVNTNKFYQYYCNAIDAIRACQPNAVLYAQTIIPLNEGRVAATGGAGHLNNNRLRLYNDLIRKAAQEKHIPFLDLYSAFAVDGSLPADASRDGVHLSGDYCRKQLEYLKSHTVDFDTLYSQPDTETEVSSDETNNPPAPDPTPVPDSNPDSMLPEAGPLPLLDGSDPTTSVQ